MNINTVSGDNYRKCIKKCGVIIDKYKVIINVLCSYYNFEFEDLEVFFTKKENRYLYLLLMKEFKCFYREKLRSDLSLKNDKSISYNLKKAEEKLLINKEFRMDYFELEEKVQENF